MKRMYLLVLFILLIFGLAGGYAVQEDVPDLEFILTQLQSGFSDIKDYIVQIHAELDMEDIDIPPMDVKIYFKKPDKIHIESDGFAMLPRQGLFINPQQFNETNFFITLSGTDSVDTIICYKLEFVPKKEDIMARKIVLWINPENWTIIKLNTISWQGQKTIVQFEYELIKNKYWMPKNTVAEVNLSGFRGFGNAMRMPGKDEDENEKSQNKKGILTVKFSNYKINTGLSDKIFENK